MRAVDAEALRTAPRVLMVGEAPPAGGLGPLGAFDCATGWGLARLDPHHPDRDLGPTGKRAILEDVLGMFERVNLLGHNPGRRERGKAGDLWPEIEARAAAAAALPTLAGRRVALMGRRIAKSLAQAGGGPWRGVECLPVGRWLTMGGLGEPAEVCVLHHPSPTNRELNPGTPGRDAMARWLAAERARLEAEAAWMRLDATTAYRYADGAFIDTTPGSPHVVDVGASLPEWRARVLREIAVNCGGQGRFTGRGMSVTAHHLLVADVTDALLDAGPVPHHPKARARATVEAMTHDCREGLTHDLTSPLKRRHPTYRADERRAAAAVDRLLGLRSTPPELAAVVHRADVLVREVESLVLWGAALEDATWPDHLLGCPTTWAVTVRKYADMEPWQTIDLWSGRLSGALAELGSDLAPWLVLP